MTAAKLREAATLLRERAESADPGPWSIEPQCSCGDFDTFNECDHDKTWRYAIRVGHPDAHVISHESGAIRRKATATYIATMSPPVALALADWLDWFAARSKTNGWNNIHAARLADAILGATS